MNRVRPSSRAKSVGYENEPSCCGVTRVVRGFGGQQRGDARSTIMRTTRWIAPITLSYYPLCTDLLFLLLLPLVRYPIKTYACARVWIKYATNSAAEYLYLQVLYTRPGCQHVLQEVQLQLLVACARVS